MPVFSYVAKDLHGTYHKGEIETSDEHQGAKLLRQKKLIIVSLKPQQNAGRELWEKYFSKVSFNDLTMMTRQLATMIQAGLVLSESLDILEEQQTSQRFKKVLRGLSTEIKGGSDFASALEKYPDIFPPIYSKLVRAGQASGKLDVILLQLADNLEKERDFKGKIRGAMIYPIVVVVMMVGVMLIMIFFVMPKLIGLYKESGITLPLPTRIMIGVATTITSFWWAILIAVIILSVAFKRFIATPDGRLMFDKIILKIPVVGRVVSWVILTNFTRTFALLLASGLAILESIRIVSQVVGNRVYKDGLEISYQGVERGLSFSAQLLGQPIFPKIVGQMAKTGEETGKLDEVMFKMADYFESETDRSLKNLTTLIEPIILVVLGIGVAFLVLSIILPIYQLTTSIK
ncbi:type II secretion system F family protein [Candidatus Daviesbacteria bacterium]|nr:type II secretion system F family protein [Candidatus Daviesbacteria bacterium]